MHMFSASSNTMLLLDVWCVVQRQHTYSVFGFGWAMTRKSKYGNSKNGIQHVVLGTCLVLLLVALSQLYGSTKQVIAVPAGWREAAPGPTVALLMIVLGHTDPKRNAPYWVAVANRRAYAAQHGYPLYLVDQHLGSGQHAAWEKLIAINAVFHHSRAAWVWMSDADAYIMNLELDVAQLVHNPIEYRNPKEPCAAEPDIIAAGSCLTKINTGSFLLKNTPWTQQFVANAWHSKFIARPAGWWDQAAVLHLYKQQGVQEHFCIVKQRAINALPGGCNDGFGGFETGDLLMHFPGGMKHEIANMTSKWLRAVPTSMGSDQLTSTQPVVFFLSGRGGEGQGAGVSIHVSMQSDMYASHQSDMPTEHDLVITQQQSGFDNPGFPVEFPPDAPEVVVM